MVSLKQFLSHRHSRFVPNLFSLCISISDPVKLDSGIKNNGTAEVSFLVFSFEMRKKQEILLTIDFQGYLPIGRDGKHLAGLNWPFTGRLLSQTLRRK